jgi:hypothetical protein
MHSSISRSGTILIIVAGISALLASLTVTFLARMRADAEEMQVVVRETQARIMLMSACNWIQEASRIGWAPPSTGPTANKETFGWIDVRDNKLGPKFVANGVDDTSRFPLRTWKRFPMYVMERPPYALQLTASYNPIRTSKSPDPVDESHPDFGMPYLKHPDPQPVVDNHWTLSDPTGATVNATRFAEWELGDQRARTTSLDLSWFRIWRESGATFVVTCGAGGTKGFRSWSEMTADDRAEFGNDQGLFETLRNAEIRLWYRVEWSAAVMGMDYHMLDHSLGRERDHYMVWPINASHSESRAHNMYGGGGHEYRTQTHARNMGGTIRWVQRLVTEPTNW